VAESILADPNAYRLDAPVPRKCLRIV